MLRPTIGAALALVLATSADVSAQSEVKQAEKLYQAELKAGLKEHRQALREAVATARDDLADFDAAVADVDGENVATLVTALVDDLTAFRATLDERVFTYLDVVGFGAGKVMQATGDPTDTSMPGRGGRYDKALERGQQLYDRALDLVARRLHKSIAKLAALRGHDLTVLLPPRELDGYVIGPFGYLLLEPQNRLHVVAATSDLAVDDDATVHVTGVAMAGDMDVTLYGLSGPANTHPAPHVESGPFQRLFENVPEGNLGVAVCWSGAPVAAVGLGVR